MIQRIFNEDWLHRFALAAVNEPSGGGEQPKQGTTPGGDIPPERTPRKHESASESDAAAGSDELKKADLDEERKSIPGLNQDENMRETAGGRIVDDEPPL